MGSEPSAEDQQASLPHQHIQPIIDSSDGEQSDACSLVDASEDFGLHPAWSSTGVTSHECNSPSVLPDMFHCSNLATLPDVNLAVFFGAEPREDSNTSTLTEVRLII